MNTGLGDIDLDALRRYYSELTPEQQAEADAILAESIPTGLPEFFSWGNPEYKFPRHLFAPGIDKEGKAAAALGPTIEATLKAPQFASFSTPPQFGKTTLILAGLLWYAHQKPGSVSAYVTSTADLTYEKSDIARAMAELIGLKPSGTKSRIVLANGSSILFTSVDGPLEGKAVTGLLVLDDPYKNRMQAESALDRKRVSNWFISTAMGRVHPTTSVLVILHRWTVDDLIEELIPKGWAWTNYPALWPDGSSLWEEFKSREWLEWQRAFRGPFTWLSEWQGQPTAKGGRLFEGVTYYSELPKQLKVAIGVDLAYTEKTSSDWSIAVAMGEYDAKWYVIEVLREQCKADVFAKKLQGLSGRFPAARMLWHCSTTERGAADVMRVMGHLPIDGVLAKGDPYLRSLMVGAAWSRGDVLLPDQKVFPLTSAWAPEYARVMTSFIGGTDAEDDDVVATASAFHQLPARRVTVQHAPGSPEAIEAERAGMRKRAVEDLQKQLKERTRRRGGDTRWRG